MKIFDLNVVSIQLKISSSSLSNVFFLFLSFSLSLVYFENKITKKDFVELLTMIHPICDGDEHIVSQILKDYWTQWSRFSGLVFLFIRGISYSKIILVERH